MGKGTFIAEISPIDDVMNLNEDNKRNGNQRVSIVELPDHLQDLFEKCRAYLPPKKGRLEATSSLSCILFNIRQRFRNDIYYSTQN